MKINRLINEVPISDSFLEKLKRDAEANKHNIMHPATYLLNVVAILNEESLTIFKIYRELLFCYINLLQVGVTFNSKLKDEKIRISVQKIINKLTHEQELSFSEFRKYIKKLSKYDLKDFDPKKIDFHNPELIYQGISEIFTNIRGEDA